MSTYSRIIGTGMGLPSGIMTNKDFEKFIDTNDEWIKTRTGISERRIVDHRKGESTLSLARTASEMALKNAGMKGADLELIIVGTVTPESVMPTTANFLQRDLASSKAFTFDLQAACSGFLYGLSVADSFIRLGKVKNALVVGAETLSTVVNWQDRTTCILFGDAAGAVVLSKHPNNEHAVLTTNLYSDGSKAELLKIPHGYSACPPYMPEYRNDQHKIQMQGTEVFKLAVRNMVEASKSVLAENNMTTEQVDYFIFHQANIRIIEMCAKTLNIPAEKMWLNLEKYGNTSAATLPICLHESWQAKAVKPGSLILMATFGGGVTWGASLIRL